MNLHETPAQSETIARAVGATLLLLSALSLALMGCAKHEKVLEIDTPGGGVEVEKITHPDGDVEIEVDAEK